MGKKVGLKRSVTNKKCHKVQKLVKNQVIKPISDPNKKLNKYALQTIHCQFSVIKKGPSVSLPPNKPTPKGIKSHTFLVPCPLQLRKKYKPQKGKPN